MAERDLRQIIDPDWATALEHDEVDVDLEPDTAPRDVETPADLAGALAADEAARATYEGLAFSHRKEWVRWVEEAKKPETRATRIARTVQSLHDGKRTR